MVDRRQITGALVDGPLALDNAIDPEAARIKQIDSPVAGHANVLMVPDLEAGNMLAKSLSFLAGADAAGIVLGARVPIILTSRADSLITRLASCAVAMLVANGQREAAAHAGDGMADVILVLNAGSSSIKFSAFDVQGDTLGLIVHGQVDGHTAAALSAVDHHGEHHEQQWAGVETFGHHEAEQIAAFLEAHQEGHRLAAVGHRVVHGGQRFSGPVRVTPEIVAELDKLTPLAPLHQPHNLTPIRILETVQPGIEQVACFDTAFHRTQPAVTQAFALPESITSRACAAMDSTGLVRVHRERAARRRAMEAARGARSSPTSATARACARSWRARASRARWGSLPSTGCRWARAAATSTRASCSS